MRIRFQPQRGTPEVELRDIKGGHPLAKWSNGEEVEIAPGTLVPFQPDGNPVRSVDAAEAIFRHGPAFVDATTGKNPLYVCADCGADALEEGFTDTHRMQFQYFTKDNGRRLCSGCWLAAHPAYVVEFRKHGFPSQVIARGERAIFTPHAPTTYPVASEDDES